MPTDTPNRGYARPDPGVGDWHVPLNENFDKIDEDVAAFSVDARPAGDIMWEPGTNEMVPLDPPEVTVPFAGSYMVVGTVEVDVGSVTQRTAAVVTLTVGGQRWEVESGSIGPLAAGPTFESVTAPYRIDLEAGQSVGMKFLHHAADAIRITSQFHNTKLQATRIAPLPRQ